MVYIHLTKSQREELSAVSRQAIGRVALRAHLVLLSDRGFTVPCDRGYPCLWPRRRAHLGAAL